MRVLLDTNVVLSWALDRESVVPDVDRLLMSPATGRVMSAVVPWEISIKWRTGRLPLPRHPRPWMAEVQRELALDLLPVTLVHATQVADLPDHHRDPFDRLLIAQAQVEGMPIVTADRSFGAYDVEVIAAR
jgi:PIN domain nuclease of toxin-antitoxin system